MKTKKLIKRMYKAIINHNLKKEAKLYKRLLKKSFKHKNTSVVQ